MKSFASINVDNNYFDYLMDAELSLGDKITDKVFYTQQPIKKGF